MGLPAVSVCLVVWLVGCFVVWLVGSFSFIVWLAGLVLLLYGCMFVRFFCCMVGWFDSFVVWLTGLVLLLYGWLVWFLP